MKSPIGNGNTKLTAFGESFFGQMETRPGHTWPPAKCALCNPPVHEATEQILERALVAVVQAKADVGALLAQVHSWGRV